MIREKLVPTTDSANNVAVPFVALTVCADYSVAYKDDALQTYGLDKSMYRRKGVYVNLTSNKGDDLRLIYDSITLDVKEILSKMTFETAHGGVKDVEIESNETSYYDDIKIDTSYWVGIGKCYSIRPNAHLLEQSIQQIDIVSRVNAYIYFGHPGQTMHTNSNTKVILLVRIILRR